MSRQLCLWCHGTERWPRLWNLGLLSRQAREASSRSGAGPGRDQSALRRAGAHQREAGDLHQHRFRDALQTSGGCWLYGKPQERKGRGKRVRAGAGEGARLRWPEGALPAAPASCWARPGWRRPWRKLLLPFSPAPAPRYWKDCVGETQKLTIIECGLGEGRTARAARRKTKSASVRAAVTRGSSGRSLRTPAAPPPVAHPQPSKIYFTRAAEDPQNTGRGEWESVTIFFFLCPAPVPTSSFLGFAAAGEGLIRFASKGCIYSVLLREARKHPSRPGRRDGKGGGPGTQGWCVRVRLHHTPFSSLQSCTFCWEGSCKNARSLATQLTTRTSPWGWSSGQNVFYNCKQ